MTPREATEFNHKNVWITCKDGYTREGRCYMYTELDDNDEIYVYFDINDVIIYLDDIAEISEITEVIC